MPPAVPDELSARTSPAEQAAVDRAITTRHSIRAFLPKPVPQATIEEILAVAARAPSGTNTQPWRVRVLTGASLTRLCDAVSAVHNDPQASREHREEYPYYPTEWRAPFVDRRRKVGWDLYGLLGIGKADKQRMHTQHGRNYRFFDAPVGLIFTIDRVMQQGSWLDYGMFLQNVMVAARARGLHTCPQAAWTPFHRAVREVLGWPDNEMLVCGMALGWADPAAIENTLITERDPVSAFASFHD
jgi:nitroreductase